MKRSGSNNGYFRQRIPADLRDRLIGRVLRFPLGAETIDVKVGPKADTIQFSLKSAVPATIKARQAEAAAYLEGVFATLRSGEVLSLSRLQAFALAGEVYDAWSGEQGREHSMSVEMTDKGPVVSYGALPPKLQAEAAKAARKNLKLWADSDAPEDKAKLDRAINPLIDRVLSGHGILKIDQNSRELLFHAFLEALKDALHDRRKIVKFEFGGKRRDGNYPERISGPLVDQGERPSRRVSLKGLVEGWWKESQALGLKVSTFDSYRNSVAALAAFLKHDDASRVTPEDIVAFKDFRLASINPRTKKPISPKTIKDSDLAGLKAVFAWAVTNRKLPSNPAVGISIKVKKRPKLRERGFSDSEAQALLVAAFNYHSPRERRQLVAAKRWVPWLMAYSGARVGEVAQLRKQDIRKEGELWVMHITPEAGTVKTDQARDVVIHPHLVEQGFPAFVEAAPPGHLFFKLSKRGGVRGSLRTIENRLREEARAVVTDENVQPNHGWRHRFKTVGMEAGIGHRILDAIQGHAPKTQGETYGDVTLKTIAAAIQKLPRYDQKPMEAPPSASPP